MLVKGYRKGSFLNKNPDMIRPVCDSKSPLKELLRRGEHEAEIRIITNLDSAKQMDPSTPRLEMGQDLGLGG